MFNESDFENRLSAVAWSEDLYSDSVPKTLLKLIRSRPDDRAKGVADLESCLLRQSSLGVNTARAIPFLLEMVTEGIAALEVYTVLTYAVLCSEALASDAEFVCRAAIRRGLEVYLRDVEDVGLPSEVRAEAASVLARLGEDRALWEPVLLKVYNQDPLSTLGVEIREWLVYWDVPV